MLEKKHLKNEQELKFTAKKMSLLKTSSISTAQRQKTVQNEIYNLNTRFLQFKEQKKSKNVDNS